MKFSSSFVVLAFILSKTTLALPVDPDAFDLVKRDSFDDYDLEVRDYFDNTYEERSHDEDELFERELFSNDLETRAKKSNKSGPSKGQPKTKPPTSKPPASKPPTSKPPASKPPTSKTSTSQPSASETPTSKTSTNQPQQSKPPSSQPGKSGICKALPLSRGRTKRSLQGRTTVGKTITVDGESYKLSREVSGQGGELTFEVEGQKFYAKRPRKTGTAPDSFTKEIADTKKASDALKSGLYISEGTNGGYQWLVTATMPGGELLVRWARNRDKFATRKACNDDLADAKKVVKGVQTVLAKAGVVHADSHPGNWFFPLTGTIDKAYPIDFGATATGSTDIDGLLNNQFKYPDDTWKLLAEGCGLCK